MGDTLHTLLSAEAIRHYTAAGHWRDDTIYALVARHAERTPEKIAVRERLRHATYGELIAAADTLAGDLAGRGLTAGDRVGVWLPSRMESALALLACSRNGYVCCPSMHRDHTAGDIVALLKRTRAAALIAQEGYGADAGRRNVFADIWFVDSLRRVYRLEPVGESTRERLSSASWPGLSRPSTPLPHQKDDVDARDKPAHDEREAAATNPKQDPNGIVYLAFTSGTTGEPKGVMHSDNTLLANARAIAKDWSIDENSIVFPLSPLSHNLAFGAMVMTLAAGGELVINDLQKGASIVDRVLETGATFLFGVPTHAIDLLAELRRRGMTSLGRVRGFRISGAAAPREVVAGLLDHGVMPQSGYGMTETCSHQYTLPSDDPRLIVETAGRACLGYEVKIFRLDDRNTEAPVGEIGEIGGRGASLMLGYFEDPAATQAAFNAQGWFMTGDLGSLDENGYLRIAGRKKDVIIRGGHNIHPARIEALAVKHPAVERAAAVAVPDDRLGEKVCLAVSFRDGQRAASDDLLAHLDAQGLSKYDMPEYVLALDRLPLTRAGKSASATSPTGSRRAA
jgi:acyl-CoA synthetase